MTTHRVIHTSAVKLRRTGCLGKFNLDGQIQARRVSSGTLVPPQG